MSTFRLISLCGLLLAGAAYSDDRSQLREVPMPVGMHLAGSEDPASSKVYIVQLKTPSAADYHAAAQIGGATKPARTSLPAAPASFNKNSAAIQGHTRRLVAEQDAVLASITIKCAFRPPPVDTITEVSFEA